MKENQKKKELLPLLLIILLDPIKPKVAMVHHPNLCSRSQIQVRLLEKRKKMCEIRLKIKKIIRRNLEKVRVEKAKVAEVEVEVIAVFLVVVQIRVVTVRVRIQGQFQSDLLLVHREVEVVKKSFERTSSWCKEE